MERYAVKTWQDHTHSLEFKVVPVLGTEGDELVYGDCMENSHNMDEVVPCASGHIKWDGCANIDYHTADCMAHYCGESGFNEFQSAILKVWAEARVIFGPQWPDLWKTAQSPTP